MISADMPPRGAEQARTMPVPAVPAPVMPASVMPDENAAAEAAVTARLDLMRGRLSRAREDALAALLFSADARQDCDALTEICAGRGWRLLAGGVAMLAEVLQRTVTAEPRHQALTALMIDALYALRRAETRPDMQQAGHDLLRGLRLAITRELGDGRI